MKNIYLVLIIALLLSCKKEKEEKKELDTTPVEFKKEQIIEQDETVAAKNEIIFTVQIAALRNENTTFSNIQNIKMYDENGLTKYRIGDFKTYQEAKKYRNQLQNTYPDAFIQALRDGVPIHITEALNN